MRSILHTVTVIFHLFSSFLTVLSKTWKQDNKEQTMKPYTQDKLKFGIIIITSRRVYSHDFCIQISAGTIINIAIYFQTISIYMIKINIDILF